MSPISIYESPYISVVYLPDQKTISHVVHKPIDPQDFKDALNAGTEALKKYGVHKWLSDDRKNGPIPADVIEWAATDWNARTIAAGWKYWANIVPTEVVAAGTLIPTMDALYEMGLRLMVFSDLNEGSNWLENVDK